MGWRASSAARALSNDRAANVGIVHARSPEMLRTEPFFMQMVAGLEQTLSVDGFSLQLALAAETETELAIYRRWWAERRVDSGGSTAWCSQTSGCPTRARSCCASWGRLPCSSALKDSVAQFRSCGQFEVEGGEVGGSGASQGCAGPPRVESDEVDGGGGEDVSQVGFG
ncbi:LacI family DNA-binding transcriptional regulator [Saccharopolyspora pogona]|uniref:hypothetical protein n=1 Tax=Saccharopolyspora pogona TaxID=333966 RepID=UPI001CC222F2|nr:hypothetical protein [Saccharopolyspora pogona]